MSQANTFAQKNKIGAILRRKSKVLFVGIGGIGMQSLAILLSVRGHTVLGTDRAPSKESLCRLSSYGIEVHRGHTAEAAAHCDMLVFSLAVPYSSPELMYARACGIPCFSRADILGYLMAHYPARVGVAGMHGKSTVTAMLAAILEEDGKDPTVVSGAPLSFGGAPLRMGGDEIFLAEACEYGNSFLSLSPTLAVVLNAELEHTDFFHSEDEVRASFAAFMQGADTVVLPAAPTRVPLEVPPVARILRFGTENGADVQAKDLTYTDGKTYFNLYIAGKNCGRVEFELLGIHNVHNATAAAAAAHALGASPAATVRALSAFRGAPMRLERKGEREGVLFFADYAHHPTEIRASLAALRLLAAARGGRLLCLFQPHTYSRTASFFCDFVNALSAADRVILLEIYAAREQNESGVSSVSLAASLPNAIFARDHAAALSHLCAEARAGDVAVIMGAGDIHLIFSLL